MTLKIISLVLFLLLFAFVLSTLIKNEIDLKKKQRQKEYDEAFWELQRSIEIQSKLIDNAIKNQDKGETNE